MKNNQHLYEVFVRNNHSIGHQHVGSVRAGDIEEAMIDARDLYTRRGEGVSVWVVKSSDIFSSQPEEKGIMFESSRGKDFRYPTYYKIPKGVKNL